MGKNNVYSKKYILKNGVDFENLWFTSNSDEILDNAEDEGGKPFNGIAYELKGNGILDYYCFYKDGMAHGNKIEFYSDEQVKCEKYYKYGQLFGESICWHENGSIMSKIIYEHSIILEQEEWDESGNLILHKKLNQDDAHFQILNSRRELHQRLGRE
ncbi:toxin-antitoxin system YwqK family antitoxin [Metabacillus dongyingensis]|uniref:toxin-antitoxin system YwqK family antitoxin n=1 Tax=Metabacillus dongyingensis TaxID=2874282 RepID=UPI003B8C213B